MIQTNSVKFYIAKYFFLAVGLIQWVFAGWIFIRFHNIYKSFPFSLVLIIYSLIALGFLLYFLFLIINNRVKRVAVGKNKIVIMEGSRNFRFEWPEIKSVKIIPFFNLYRLRIRGKKESIYFFPSEKIEGIIELPLEKVQG